MDGQIYDIKHLSPVKKFQTYLDEQTMPPFQIHLKWKKSRCFHRTSVLSLVLQNKDWPAALGIRHDRQLFSHNEHHRDHK